MFSDADRASPHVRPRHRRRCRIGPGRRRRATATSTRSLAVAPAHGADARPSRLRVPLRGRRRSRPPSRPPASRSSARRPTRSGGSAPRTRRAPRPPPPGVPLLPGTAPFVDVDAAVAAAGAVGFPLLVKSVAGGGGIGMLACDRPGRAPGGRRARPMQQSAQAFGNPRGVPRAAGREGAPRRGAGVRRRRGHGRDARRPRLLDAAPPPEGGRGDAGARPRPRPTRAALADAARRAARARALPVGGHGRVRGRRRHRRVPLPRGEHPPAGRAHGHRGGHRRRPRGVDGARSPPATPRSLATASRGTRPTGPRDRGARLRRGPGTRLPCPSPGLVTEAAWPAGARVDTWVAHRHRGHARSTTRCWPRSSCTRRRASCRRRDCDDALRATTVRGIETNRRPPRVVRRRPARSARATVTTATLEDAPLHRRGRRRARAGEHHRAGPPRARRATGTSASRRAGRWTTARSALGNRILGNPDGARRAWSAPRPGPRLRFATADASVCLTGARPARHARRRAGRLVRAGRRAGRARRSRSGAASGPGLRTYVLVRGGFDVGARARERRRRSPSAASAATAAASCAPATCCTSARRRSPPATASRWRWHRPSRPGAHAPSGSSRWSTARTPRPTSSPTRASAAFYATDWQVHHHSSRTGVRLVGPPRRVGTRPTAARPGCTRRTCTTRRTPSARSTSPATCRSCSGPTARASAGFTCPVTVVTDDRWKLGQLAPGDIVRFVSVDRAEARAGPTASRTELATRTRPSSPPAPRRPRPDRARPPAPRATTSRRSRTARQGDAAVLVEYGPMTLDFDLRLRAHALGAWLDDRVDVHAGRGRPRGSGRCRCSSTRSRTRPSPSSSSSRTPKTSSRPSTTWSSPAASCTCRSRGTIPPTREAIETLHARRCATTRPGARGTSSSSAGSTACRRSMPCATSSSTPSTSCSGSATCTSARRSRCRSIRATGSSPRSTTRRARGRPRTRSESAARTSASTAWRARAATSSSAAPCRCGARYGRAAHTTAPSAVVAPLLRPHPLVPGRRRRAARAAGRRRARAGSTSASTTAPSRAPSTARS